MRPLHLALAVSAALLCANAAHAARFTYHGELMDGDAPAEGAYDLRLRSFADPGAKAALGAATELPAVAVSDGRFALEVDLPESPLGQTFVEVALRKAGSDAPFEVLGSPQAISKANTGCWALDGNTGLAPGSFLGLADPLSTSALELRARNARVASFVPDGTLSDYGDSPRIALGSSANQATARGANVSGGGATLNGVGAACPDCRNLASGVYASVGGGLANTAGGGGSTVAGGSDNLASGSGSTVGGGLGNLASGADGSTVAGGESNRATGFTSAVGGGLSNTADGSFAGVLSGQSNVAVGEFSTVLGGLSNCAGGDHSVALGRYAFVRPGIGNGISPACALETGSGDADGDEGSFVWADSQETVFSSSGPRQFLVRADGGIGVNTSRMGQAANLRAGELVLRNASIDPNTDIALLTGNDRGYGLVSEPGAGSAAGRFYITEINATTASVGFTPRLRIDPNGTTFVQGGAVGDISDARLKKNIAPIPRPLDTFLGLRGHMFEYRDPASAMSAPGPRLGFVAQEVRDVLPGWVVEDETGVLGIRATGFEALAVEALRDLKTESDLRLEALERDQAELRAENAALRARLDRLLARLDAGRED
jgi:hypothetical protein